MLDAVMFEQVGIPAVPIVTRPFMPTAIATAALHGLSPYAVAAVDHPISSLTDSELAERARAVAPAVAAALLELG